MTGFLTSETFWTQYGDAVTRRAGEIGFALEPVFVPADPGPPLAEADLQRIELAYFSGDIIADGTARGFFGVAQTAPNLRWMHLFNAGTDSPIFSGFLAKGIRLTTSSGTTAMPIGQTLIGALLMLARGFPHFAQAQRRHAWERLPFVPEDLATQTLTVLGLGAIGSEVARLAQAIGLHVIGVRRSPLREGDPVDELVPPSELGAVLPRTHWLAIACPLTDETRHIIDAAALGKLPRGAHILNIARGAVIDEPALIAALQSGHLGGAYLDVFEVEPLPPESPLWEMANVIVSPHNSPAAAGNDDRAAAYFLRNLEAWAKGGEMVNEVR